MKTIIRGGLVVLAIAAGAYFVDSFGCIMVGAVVFIALGLIRQLR